MHSELCTLKALNSLITSSRGGLDALVQMQCLPGPITAFIAEPMNRKDRRMLASNIKDLRRIILIITCSFLEISQALKKILSNK